MKLLLIHVIGLVGMFGMDTVICCSCMGTVEDFMCSADFVAKVQVVDEQIPSMDGAYQVINTLDVYKGKDDITRAYSGTSGPNEPITSCDGYPLTKGESYIITGSYYDNDGDDTVASILYSGCQFLVPLDNVTLEQFYFIEALRDGDAEC